MKKKIFSLFLTICMVMGLAVFGLNNTPKTNTAIAYAKNESTYTISGTDDAIVITKGTSDTKIAENIDSLETAISTISAAETNTDEIIEILFDNVSLEIENVITLDRNYLFSGKLITKNVSSLFVANHSNGTTNSISFQNFEAINAPDMIADFSFLQVDGASTNITLFNAHFKISSPSSETTHAIKFNSTNHTITMHGEVSHSTTLLYNYISGVTLNIDDDDTIEDNFFEDAEGKPKDVTEYIYISIPYNASNSIICQSIVRSNANHFKFVPNDNFFEVSTLLMDGKILCSAKLSFEFDYNDATKNDDYTSEPNQFSLINYNEYIFPTTENMSKAHYTFDGWFGVVTVNDTDYYFDQILLKEFIDSNKTTDDIPTTFKTNLNDFSIENSFEQYKYTSHDTESAIADFEAVNLMASLGQNSKFIAKWNVNYFTISFNSNGGNSIDSQTIAYEGSITEPSNPTRIGYDFAGWFTSLDFDTEFDFSMVMPAENFTIYAKWNVKQYTISFITNSSETVSPITYNFGEQMQAFELLSQTGYIFEGWFEYNTETLEVSDTVFQPTTMPAENITLYAKWSTEKVTLSFNTKGGNSIDSESVDYGEKASRPADPTRTGYTFNGWYYDYNCTEANKVTFDQDGKITLTENTTIYANWLANSYHLNIYKNIDNTFERQTFIFGQSITLPVSPERANYTFAGWFIDAEFTNSSIPSTMPAHDISIYAKWKAKPLPTFDGSTQYYNTDAIYPEFINKSNLSGFIIKYNVNGEWVSEPPTEAGSYDILVTRNEDYYYARFEKLLEDALVIERTEKDIMWIIVLLFVFAAFELLVTIVARVLRKMKQNMAIYSLIIPVGASYISTSQTVLLFVAIALVVIFFITMAYQMVKLHRTIPLELIKEDEDIHQTKEHFEYNEKVIEEEVKSYSAKDIEQLLINDTVGQDIKDKHKLNELEKQEEKEKIPIAGVEYDEESESIRGTDSINNPEPEIEEDEMNPNVEFVDEEFVLNTDDEQSKIYNSDDPFVRKDPDDYSS